MRNFLKKNFQIQGPRQCSHAKAGVGIAEVLIGAIFVGLGALLVGQAATYFRNSKLSQEQDLAFLRMVQGVEMILGSQVTCDANMRSRGLAGTGPDFIEVKTMGVLDTGDTGSLTPFLIVGGAVQPGSLLSKINLTEMNLESQGFLNTAGGTFERFKLKLRAQRPGMNLGFSRGEFARDFEVVLRMSDATPARTVQNCQLPTMVSSAAPTSTDPATACAQMGGVFDYKGTSTNTNDDTCDVRAQICASMGVNVDPATGRCMASQIKQAMRTALVANGPCDDVTDTIGAGPSSNFDNNASELRYLRGVGIDGSPRCGPSVDLAGGVPINPGQISPGECGRCYAPSAVACFNRTGDDRIRYRIFEGGVFVGSQCGNAGLAAYNLTGTAVPPGQIPLCRESSQYKVPCAP